MGAFRKFHGKELDLNNSYKSGLEAFSSYHIQILKVNYYQPDYITVIKSACSANSYPPSSNAPSPPPVVGLPPVISL